MKLVISTSNIGKLTEIETMLGKGYEIKSISEFTRIEPQEDGATFRDNAMIKAKFAYAHSKLPSIGDDSGLCIDELGGEPGIYSARYAPTNDERITKVLSKMQGIQNRNAHFTCAIAYYDGKNEFCVESICEGKILLDKVGGGGFGYDPIFFSNDLNKSFAIASEQEKNSVSHRGKALEMLKSKINELIT